MALRHDHGALYVGTCLFGLCLSSVTPTAISLAEQFIDLTCKYIIDPIDFPDLTPSCTELAVPSLGNPSMW